MDKQTKKEIKLAKNNFSTRIKELQKNFKENAVGDPHPGYKKEWLEVIKYDNDYSFSGFLPILIYKLEKMKTYLDTYARQWLAEEEINEQIKELDEAITIGKRIEKDEYDNEWFKFDILHSFPAITIRKLADPTSTADNEIKKFVLRYKNAEDLITFSCTAEDRDNLLPISRDVYDLHLLLGKKVMDLAEDWCKEHNYKHYKDVSFAHFVVWDSQDNKEKCQKLLEKGGKDRQKDIKKFFAVLIKNFDVWGD